MDKHLKTEKEKRIIEQMIKLYCNHHNHNKERKESLMRYSGPRMLFYHPLAALAHLWNEWR